MKSLFLIPLLLLVTIAPLMAYSQTAGSGGTNTQFVPAEEFNPILTPIDPTPLNSNSTFFDDWCETNESGTNVDAGTWICWYDIEQMYDDIIVLWNDEAEVLQVELDEANDKIALLNNTLITLQSNQLNGTYVQSQLDMLTELSVPDFDRLPIILSYETSYDGSIGMNRYYTVTIDLVTQSFNDFGTSAISFEAKSSPPGHWVQPDYIENPDYVLNSGRGNIYHEHEIEQYSFTKRFSGDYPGDTNIRIRGEINQDIVAVAPEGFR